MPPQKLENFVFLKLESCNLMNIFGCKFRAGKVKKKKKKNSTMNVTDPNLAFWEKFWLTFARIIKNQPFFFLIRP